MGLLARLFFWIEGIIEDYRKNKKHTELMQRLSRNEKFNQKDYLKRLQEQKKALRIKNRERQEDAKR